MLPAEDLMLRPAIESVTEPARWLAWAISNLDEKALEQLAWVRARNEVIAECAEMVAQSLERHRLEVPAMRRLTCVGILRSMVSAADETSKDMRNCDEELPELVPPPFRDIVDEMKRAISRVDAAALALGETARSALHDLEESSDPVVQSLVRAEEVEPDEDETRALTDCPPVDLLTTAQLLQRLGA